MACSKTDFLADSTPPISKIVFFCQALFNSNLICYIKDNKIHSIKDNKVLIVEGDFFGRDILDERDRLNRERKKKIELIIKEVKKEINREYDTKIRNLKISSIPVEVSKFRRIDKEWEKNNREAQQAKKKSEEKKIKQREEENQILEYTIIQTNNISIPNARRLSYRIQLNEVYTQDEAIQIAEKIIKANHEGNKDLVNALKFFFYFPGSDSSLDADGSIDWAPDGNRGDAHKVKKGDYSTFRFKIKFYEYERGRRIQQLQTNEEIPNDSELIGKWIEGGVTAGVTTIISKDGKYFMERKYHDGSSLKQEITEESSSKGRRFNLNNSFGEYVIVHPNGKLGFYDSDGLVKTLSKAK